MNRRETASEEKGADPDAETVRAVVEALVRRREALGISQRRLSHLTGLSRSGIRHMENGETSPTLYFLLKVCRALDSSLADLIKSAEKG